MDQMSNINKWYDSTMYALRSLLSNVSDKIKNQIYNNVRKNVSEELNNLSIYM